MNNTIVASCPDLMTVIDVKKYLRISKSKVYQLVDSGKLQCLRVGRSIRIPKTYLLEYINQYCYNIPKATGEPSTVLKEVAQ